MPLLYSLLIKVNNIVGLRGETHVVQIHLINLFALVFLFLHLPIVHIDLLFNIVLIGDVCRHSRFSLLLITFDSLDMLFEEMVIRENLIFSSSTLGLLILDFLEIIVGFGVLFFARIQIPIVFVHLNFFIQSLVDDLHL